MLFRWLLCCCRKMILYNRTRLFLCRSLLHRRDGNRVIRRLCLCLSAPAQNSHKSQRQSCYVPFFMWYTSFIVVVSAFTFHSRKLQCTLPHTRFPVRLCCFPVQKRINRYRNDRTVRAEHTHEQRNFRVDCQVIDRFLPCSNSCRQSLHRQTVSLRRIHNLCISAKLWRIHSNLIVRIRRIAVTLEFDRALPLPVSRTTQPKRGILIFSAMCCHPIYNSQTIRPRLRSCGRKNYTQSVRHLVCGRFLHRCKG